MDHFLDALRVRIGPGARRMLRRLVQSAGPLHLIHRPEGEGRGVVEWVAAACARDPGLIPWADTGVGRLFVQAAEARALRDRQLMLGLEIQGGAGDDDAGIRLATLLANYWDTADLLVSAPAE